MFFDSQIMKRTMQKLPIKWCISYFFPFTNTRLHEKTTLILFEKYQLNQKLKGLRELIPTGFFHRLISLATFLSMLYNELITLKRSQQLNAYCHRINERACHCVWQVFVCVRSFCRRLVPYAKWMLCVWIHSMLFLIAFRFAHQIWIYSSKAEIVLKTHCFTFYMLNEKNAGFNSVCKYIFIVVFYFSVPLNVFRIFMQILTMVF